MEALIKQNLTYLLNQEKKRQMETLQLIPSENFTSKYVRKALSSVITNKYSEGYPGKRYYQGNKIADLIENQAIERAKILFNVPYANVQPYSGSPANIATLLALLNQGDVIMGMKLSSGGHLTHGHPDITFSGLFYKTIQYGTDDKGFIDFNEIEKLALEYKPKIIFSGATAYPRKIEYDKFSQIADKINAWHIADISHLAGLIIGKVHQSPRDYAHIITTTTHKTLRGPRGAIIMATEKGINKDPDLPQKLNKAVFPGIQGGPHDNVIAAIDACLEEAATEDFLNYSKQIVNNSKVLSEELKSLGFNLVTNGTDNHLILINLADKNIDGWYAALALEAAGIIVNKNTIPNDDNSPYYPSGIRLGTPAITTLGMKENEMKIIANYINHVINISRDTVIKGTTLGINKSDDKTLNQEYRKEYKSILKSNRELKQIKKEIKDFCLEFSKSKTSVLF